MSIPEILFSAIGDLVAALNLGFDPLEFRLLSAQFISDPLPVRHLRFMLGPILPKLLLSAGHIPMDAAGLIEASAILINQSPTNTQQAKLASFKLLETMIETNRFVRDLVLPQFELLFQFDDSPLPILEILGQPSQFRFASGRFPKLTVDLLAMSVEAILLLLELGSL